MKKTSKWILVAAARPNFMKIAPLIRAINAHNGNNSNAVRPFLVHTGQHYDDNMSEVFFRDLGIPEPDIHLGIGSGTHAEQTGKVMIEFEKILIQEKPDLIIVVGDVNSTVACALAAAKLQVPIAHVEAGLRSFDRTMPEEINRIVTDALSDFLFTPSADGDANLLREGVPQEKIFLVGDIMVDSLLFNLDLAKQTSVLERFCLRGSKNPQTAQPYALLTLHRPANVDNYRSFSRILEGLSRVAERIPILFPMHPRTRKQIELFKMDSFFMYHGTSALQHEDYFCENQLRKVVHACDPLSYLDFLNLVAHATVVLTDSGGIQEETTALNVPCVTLRDTTERPITLSEGTNVLVHDDPEKIYCEALKALEGGCRKGACPEIWDGHTAKRIIDILIDKSRLSS